MPRRSPVHYVAPSSISIMPNANESANDIAVVITHGAKIRVYSQKIPQLGFVNNSFQDWSFEGRNRRLSDSDSPYTIYARLQKDDKSNGYLVFAPKVLVDGQWKDKYAYVTMNGLSADTAGADPGNYWYVRLGEVSLPENDVRTLTLDTGTLGTDQYNADWSLNPDDMPLHVELSTLLDGDASGVTTYVPWSRTLTLSAALKSGWGDDASERIDHWTITRNSGDAAADQSWPDAERAITFSESGVIRLSHARGDDDDFCGAVSATFDITAWGHDLDGGVDLVRLASESITILAETAEKYELVPSVAIVNYDPSSDSYSPSDGVKIRVRATDQRGDVSYVTRDAYAAASLVMSYSVAGSDVWVPLTVSSVSGAATAVIPISAFSAQKSVSVRLRNTSGAEYDNRSVSFVRNGEDSREREWIFLRSQTPITFGDAHSQHPLPSLINVGEVNPTGAAGGDDNNKNQDGWVPQGWFDEQHGTDETMRYEYGAYRSYERGDGGDSSSSSSGEHVNSHWGDFSTPVVWGYYAEDGVSYRCRWTLGGSEIYQIVTSYNGALRGTLPLVATLLRRKGDGQEEVVPASSCVINVACQGVAYSKTVTTQTPQFIVSEESNPEFIPHLNDAHLTGLSIVFTIGGEQYPFTIPTIKEADEATVTNTMLQVGSRMFLSKLLDDEAQGFIRFVKGLQIGGRYTSDLMGEGGVFKVDSDGKTYIEADKMYIRMKAYFDNVEIKDYKHSSGNRIASKAGMRCVKVEAYDANDELLETDPQQEPAGTDYYRCYFRAKDGEDSINNDFAINDQAFCDKTSVENGAVVHHRYWRLVVGRNGSLAADEEFGYIDLDNTDKESGSAVPLAGDDISQLGNRTDSDRQGAIIEFVGGENAPSYQMYQGINNYSWNGKNMIDMGYDSSTGHAHLNVSGDFRFGSPSNSGSYIKYTQANGGSLQIKAHVTFTNTNQELDELVQSHQRDDSYDDTEVKAGITSLSLVTEDLQRQIDGAIESYFMTGVPTLNNLPASGWTTDTEKDKHVGDLYYDKATGHGYRFMYDNENDIYKWIVLTDEGVLQALNLADEALGTANGKSTTYLTQPSSYKQGDTWILQSAQTINGVAYKAGDVLTASVSSESFVASHWSKRVRYTDDTKFDSYIDAILRGSSEQGDAYIVAAAQKAIRDALGGATTVSGGLVLTSWIGMRDSMQRLWAGISGQYQSSETGDGFMGHGIAAWYGGEYADWEVYKKTHPTATITDAFAKSLFRYDGSGYFAGGNISWDKYGRVTIKDITTLISGDTGSTDILNALTTFNNAFHFSTVPGDTTVLGILPQAGFSHLDILEGGVLKPVATQEWVGKNYISIAFFDRLFRAYNGTGSSATRVNANDMTSTIDNIKAMFGFWTEQYISSLGQNASGGGGGGQGDVTWALLENNSDRRQIAHSHLEGALSTYALKSEIPSLSGYATQSWVAQNFNYYTLPTASASDLGGVKVGSTLAISSGVLNLPTTGVTAGTYKRVTVDAYGRVTSGDNSDADTNTWRNIYTGGTSRVGTGIDTKAINFVAGSNVSISYEAAGTGSGQSGNANYFNIKISATDTTYSAATQSAAGLMSAADKMKLDGVATGANNYSLPLAANGTRGGVQVGYTTSGKNYAVQLSGEKMYVNVPWENTWRGIQDNLTSDSTTDSLSAYQGKLLNLNKLGLSGGTLTGTLTTRDVVVQSAYTLKIGDAILKWDSTNNALKLYKLSGSSEVAVNFYATGGVSALGQGSQGGGGGQGDVTWALLANNSDERQIALSHLTGALTDYALKSEIPSLSGYATQSWVSTNFALKSDIPTLATLSWSGYSSGSYNGSGAKTISIPSNTNQLTNGAGFITSSALSSYLPLSGGTLTGRISRESGGSWISGRDTVIVYTTRTSSEGSDWHPVVGGKTSSGFWSLGSVGGESLMFSYDTDANYNAGNNTSTVLRIPITSGGTLATESFVTSRGYVTSSGVTSVATGTGLTGGTITSTGTISINSTYQTYISHGESAYNSLGNYLPLSGGTMSGGINMGSNSITNLGVGGGIYWNPYVESSSDNTDAASIYVTSSGVAGGTTLVISQQNDSNDTIQFVTNSGATLYHNSNAILTSGNYTSYVTLSALGIASANVNYANSAGAVAWGNITGKPINFKSYSGSLASEGWKIMQGNNSTPSLAISYNNGGASWNSGTYSATLVYGCSDTRGMLDCAYNVPTVTFGGGSYGSSTDDNPAWYMTISGTNGALYNLDSMPYATTSGYANSAGNASTVGSLSVHSGRNNEANKIVRTDGSGYIQAGWINTTSGNFTGTPDRIFASNDAYVRYMTPANFFPTLANDSNQLSVTVGGQNRKLTIAYATNAGNADTVDGEHSSAFLHLTGGTMTGALNFSARSGGYSNSLYSDALIYFGLTGKLQSDSTYYPWLSGIDRVNGYGYGNTVVLGTYHYGLDETGFYIGESWDGAASDKFYYFNRNGDATFQGSLTIRSGNDNKIVLDNNDNEIYWSLISFKQNGSEYGRLGTSGSTDLKWNNNVIIHSGNIGSQSVNYANSAGNADTVDGHHANSFMPATPTSIELNSTGSLSGYGGFIDFHFNGSSADYTSRIIEEQSGMLSFHSNLYINGNVGIGTSSPSYRLHVAGDIYATGGVTSLSDARHKTIMGDTKLRVEQIAEMPAITYKWNDRRDNDIHVGSIAQNWQRVLPEVVSVANDLEGTLSINYGVAAMIASIVTAKKVVDHEARIKALESENRELQQALSFVKNAYDDLKSKYGELILKIA